MTAITARRVPDMLPGTPEWLQVMTASKVPAVLGLSPWESRFSLWHRMAGLIDPQPENRSTMRGHYLEDAVVAWLADQYPHLRFGRTGTWANKARPWQCATPDRIARDGRRPVAVAEVKTAADWEEWGPDGSDIIPPYYRAQAVWQMDTLGLPVAHIGVLLPRLMFRGYTLSYDAGEADRIRGQARGFLDSLPGGPAECPPDIDAHDETYVALRALHPEIIDEEIEVPADLAGAYCAAVTGLRAAEDEHQLRRSELAAHMGEYRKAVVKVGEASHVIASRQARGSGTPFVVAARALPDLSSAVAA